MQKQKNITINSIEEGMKMIKKRRKVAVIGGRETLFFDIQRFGNFLRMLP